MIGSEDMSPTLRCFLAFDLPEEIRAVVKRVHGDLNKSPLDVRWVRPGNVHLTVVFLGNVAVDDLQPLGEQVKAVCTKYGPFEIGLNGVGVFGGMKSPRVLWLGVEGDVERMGFFQKAISKRIRPFGIKEEKRAFHPHLTLGRFRRGAHGGQVLRGLLERYSGLSSPVCTLEELTLFRSDLRSDGAKYTKIQSWPLEGKK